MIMSVTGPSSTGHRRYEGDLIAIAQAGSLSCQRSDLPPVNEDIDMFVEVAIILAYFRPQAREGRPQVLYDTADRVTLHGYSSLACGNLAPGCGNIDSQLHLPPPCTVSHSLDHTQLLSMLI